MEPGENSPLKKILDHLIAGGLTMLVLVIIYGTFTVFDDERQVNVTQTFAVNVTPAGVPEPVSIVLLGSGLSGLLISRRRRKQRNDP